MSPPLPLTPEPSAGASKAPPDDYDSPWKEYLDKYFEPFLAFFFPQAHAEIDWAAGVEHLDVELRQVIRDAELSEQRADKLVKIHRLDGTERYLIVHVEVQTSHDSGLPRRVFVYNYRTYDRHEVPVVSLVVLGDTGPQWRPSEYGWDIWDCRMGIEFPVVKLIDYNEQWSELEAETNPFALVVMAHLKTKETRGDAASRLAWKTTLVRMLYERGYERQDVLELYRLLVFRQLEHPVEESVQLQDVLTLVAAFVEHADQGGLPGQPARRVAPGLLGLEMGHHHQGERIGFRLELRPLLIVVDQLDDSR